MDKSWMFLSRVSREYSKGLDDFLDFAFANSSIGGKIVCPCVKCGNSEWVSRLDAKVHLTCDGFIKGYTRWIAHGEAKTSLMQSSAIEEDRSLIEDDEGEEDMGDMHDDMRGLLHDAFGVFGEATNVGDNSDCAMEGPDSGTNTGPNLEAERFYSLLKQSEKELYPGCKNFSCLSFIVRMYHIKCLGKCTDKAFTMMLELLKSAFPNASLPSSFYETKKMIKDLGLGYQKIDACPNDCMLYWKENAKKEECDVCHASRYKKDDDDETMGEPVQPKKGNKISAKVLRYFPLKPRLQRLFMSSKTASFMKWHDEGRTKDGCMRHPADSPAWKTFDFEHPEFAKDPRNVRLGLACDGFNPNRTMSVSHSTWPVVLMPYNLAPWMCMKQPYFMLSLLIPGPSAPGNNLDVYLQPLVDELKELWDVGVNTYDASSNQNFQMRASLLWTISDFPAYANFSGWSTKGKLACPSCHEHTCSYWLNNGGKFCYMGHRRFLDSKHPFRNDRKAFDGTEEKRKAPPKLFGSKVLEDLAGYNITFGKLVKDNPELPFSWKKRSILFDLPYWKDNLLRHNLDVMHIEKNVCDSILGTLMNVEGKSKDHHKARLDLQQMGIRSELHPITQNESNRIILPPACFAMDKKEKEIFCKVLKKVKVPDGYASNISRCVQLKPPKIFGLKSHDNHILMQQLLPLAVRKVLPKHVRSPLIRLCRYFRELCFKVLHPRELIRLENEIAEILCQLERIFPPSFFDVMVHLTVHLASEAKVAGPVQYRWMYPIERYLSTLKSYVRNRSRPEGSIAEGYLAEECLSFCSLYLDDDIETKYNKRSRNHDDGVSESTFPIFSMPGRPVGNANVEPFDPEILDKAHQYVLFNCKEVDQFINDHYMIVRSRNPRARMREITRIHNEEFSSWFSDHVSGLYLAGDKRITEELRVLAQGPEEMVKRYKGFIVNGFRFHVKELERKRKTQNSGVVVDATTPSFSSARDENPITGDLTYYGVLKDVVELYYKEDKKVVLFDCDWVAEGKRKREDEHGFTLVNFTGLRPHNEPFILASQAQQVFYVEDPTEMGWHVVIKTTARDTYDMSEQPCEDDVETYLQSEPSRNQENDVNNEDVVWVREGVQGTTIIL